MPLATRILTPAFRRAGDARMTLSDLQNGRSSPSRTKMNSPGNAGGINFVNPALLAFIFLLAFAFNASADGVRLRDLVMIAGARDNQLVGFGLVAGLAGDGDKDPIYTQQTIANMLQRYGINVQSQLAQISAKNVAVVMVTADIAAFV